MDKQEAKKAGDIIDIMFEKKIITCDKHGEYEATAYYYPFLKGPMWSQCPTCIQEIEKRGMVNDTEPDFAFVPPRYRKEDFDTYICETDRQRKVVAWFRDYKGDKNVIVHGEKGTGKTHLLWSLVKSNPDAVYYCFSDIVRRVKCSFSPTANESEADILRELAGVKLLVIDEIGRQNGTAFETNLFFDLINKRYDWMLPTVLCSNLPMEGDPGISTYIGDAALDRLNENAVEINCDWKNYRAKKGQEFREQKRDDFIGQTPPEDYHG